MLIHIGLALALVTASLGGPLSRIETAHPTAGSEGYRLPTNVRPMRYDIRLAPDFTSNTFTGTVQIRIKVVQATNTIVLHKAELEINVASISVQTGTQPSSPISVTNAVASNDDKEFYTITLGRQLAQNEEIRLVITNFQGSLNNDNRGFYLASYTNEQGTARKFGTTQFEPTSARRAFPCFDEPLFKAVFGITIALPNGYSAVSNMPAKTTTATEIVFEDTLAMSTYLIAFIVSDLGISQQQDRQRVIARPVAITNNLDDYALTTGENVLEAMEAFVGVEYSFPKIDQAAIPDNYFSAGAMENWGLVTYRETYLLYSATETPLSRRQSIATIIAHEYGHQWFGNLVSPEWWTYIWLNEGFATYFEFQAAAIAEPTWDLMEQFVISNLQYAFGPDSLDTTRPMNTDAGPPSDISNLFDTIAYEKSGSVIRMMEKFLTTPVFKQGLNNYLTARQFKEATPAHLYESLQAALDAQNVVTIATPIADIMRTWDSNAGYPVITATREYGTANVNLKQERFRRDDANAVTGAWIVPITYGTQNTPGFNAEGTNYWLSAPQADIQITGLDDDQWLLLNKKQVGYYRVNYDQENWIKLIAALKTANHGQIDRLNRAQLLDDVFHLARSGRLTYNVALELMTYLNNERDYFPLYSYFNAINFVNSMYLNTEIQAPLQNQIITLLGGVYEAVGFEETATEAHIVKLNRVQVLRWMCNLGHTDCLTKATERFTEWKAGTAGAIPLNLEEPIFCGAMKKANQADWDALYQLYSDSASDIQKRDRIIRALGCSEEQAVLNGYLTKTITLNSGVSAPAVFSAVYSAGSVGVQTSLNFLNDHFADLLERVPQATLTSIIQNIGARLTTQEQVDTLNTLSTNNPEQQPLFATGLINARANVAFGTRTRSQFSSFYATDDTNDDDGSAQIYGSIFVMLLGYILAVVV